MRADYFKTWSTIKTSCYFCKGLCYSSRDFFQSIAISRRVGHLRISDVKRQHFQQMFPRCCSSCYTVVCVETSTCAILPAHFPYSSACHGMVMGHTALYTSGAQLEKTRNNEWAVTSLCCFATGKNSLQLELIRSRVYIAHCSVRRNQFRT